MNNNYKTAFDTVIIHALYDFEHITSNLPIKKWL